MKVTNPEFLVLTELPNHFTSAQVAFREGEYKLSEVAAMLNELHQECRSMIAEGVILTYTICESLALKGSE